MHNNAAPHPATMAMDEVLFLPKTPANNGCMISAGANVIAVGIAEGSDMAGCFVVSNTFGGNSVGYTVKLLLVKGDVVAVEGLSDVF